MRGGPRGFRPGFPCPAVLRYFRSEAQSFRLRGPYPLRRAVPCTSPTTELCNSPTRRQTDQLKPYNPPVTTPAAYHVTEGLGSSLFARHYSGSRGFFPFLWVLRCFSSPACLCAPYVFRCESQRITTGGFPHSEIPGSKVGQHLTRAYRSRPRPSSALGAKASTVCPYSLDREELIIRSYGVFKVRASSMPAQRENAEPESLDWPGLSKLNSKRLLTSRSTLI